MFKKRIISGVVVFILISVFLSPASALTTVEDILDGQTAFRWNRDYLAWVVHYPEDIVGPWVMAATSGAGDPTGKVAADFKESLRMNDSTAVLLSLHCYNQKAIDLKPLSEKFFLINDGGERVSPKSYDSIFDSPLSGLVQGLVFFPKVDGPFEMVLEGNNGRELDFEFPENVTNRVRKELSEEMETRYGAKSAAKVNELKAGIEESTRKAMEERQNAWDREREGYREAIQKISSQRDLLRQRLDRTLDELARRDTKPVEPERVVMQEPVELPQEEPVAPGYSRDQVAELFVTEWKKGNHGGMEDFLSPAFKEQIGTGGLGDLLKEKSLPSTLPGDGKYSLGEEEDRVKVVFAQKILVMRTLRSARLELTRLKGGWYISDLK